MPTAALPTLGSECRLESPPQDRDDRDDCDRSAGAPEEPFGQIALDSSRIDQCEKGQKLRYAKKHAADSCVPRSHTNLLTQRLRNEKPRVVRFPACAPPLTLVSSTGARCATLRELRSRECQKRVCLLLMQWTAPTLRHLGAKMVVYMNHREIGAVL